MYFNISHDIVKSISYYSYSLLNKAHSLYLDKSLTKSSIPNFQFLMSLLQVSKMRIMDQLKRKLIDLERRFDFSYTKIFKIYIIGIIPPKCSNRSTPRDYLISFPITFFARISPFSFIYVFIDL